MRFNEDTLAQETTANYLRDHLGWESVYAYNAETFGKEGTLGRKDETEVVLTRYLGEALMTLNPGLPADAYQPPYAKSPKRPSRNRCCSPIASATRCCAMASSSNIGTRKAI